PDMYALMAYQQMAMAAGMRPDQMGETPRLVTQLKRSLLPSEREMAAEALARCDWRMEPQIVDALVQSAKVDPAPVVRAACVRALGKMKANTVPVVHAVQTMKADQDARVRHEVEQTLAVLTKP